MRTQWTAKGNRDAGSSCLCDRGFHRYFQNFGGGRGCLNTPNPPSVRQCYRRCLTPPVKKRGRCHDGGPATHNGESRLDTRTSYVASSIVGSKSEEETTARTFLQDYRNLLARLRALWQRQIPTCWSRVETATGRPIAVCLEIEGTPFEHLLQPLRGAFYNLLSCTI